MKGPELVAWAILLIGGFCLGTEVGWLLLK